MTLYADGPAIAYQNLTKCVGNDELTDTRNQTGQLLHEMENYNQARHCALKITEDFTCHKKVKLGIWE